ncbi:hypothetical protein [Micromonospora sp. NPDC023956]
MPAGDGTNRETAIDRMEFDTDGTIRPVVPTLQLAGKPPRAKE